MTPVEMIKKLAAGERHFVMPTVLTLADGQSVKCLQVLRLLPKKRLVLLVEIDEIKYVLKLFSAQGSRSAYRERQALEGLAATEIPHAKLIRHDIFADSSALHIYEYIDNAYSPIIDDVASIKAAVALIINMASAGWIQADPHPGNFLYRDQHIWLIDAGSVQVISKDNRQLFLAMANWVAQFPVYKHYQLAEYVNQQCNNISVKLLKKKAEEIWQRRKKNYLKKIVRNCSDVEIGHTKGCEWKIRREYDGQDLRQFLESPEMVMSKGKLLKSGGATHVVRVTMDGHDFIVKRYNHRNLWQFIKTLLGFGRARQNWISAHLLDFCGIDTPKPVAMLQLCQNFRSVGYIVTCAIPGIEYLHAFDKREPEDDEIKLAVDLLHKLQACKIEHGDMKAKNLLLHRNHLYLIDLDALKNWNILWKYRADRDIRRFMKNWLNKPALFQQFDTYLALDK